MFEDEKPKIDPSQLSKRDRKMLDPEQDAVLQKGGRKQGKKVEVPRPKENPRQAEVEDLYQSVEWYRWDTNYAFIFADHTREIRKHPEIAEQLKARRLIDLGCGDSYLNILWFATRFEVPAYVGVDRGDYVPLRFEEGGERHTISDSHQIENGAELVAKYLRKKYNDEAIQPIHFQFVPDDMLRYLAGEPDGSANITSNGFAIPDLPRNKAYLDRLAEEVARVVPVGGIVLTLENRPFHRLTEQGFQKTEIGQIECYIKEEQEEQVRS